MIHRLLYVFVGCLLAVGANAANLRLETPHYHVLIRSQCDLHSSSCHTATMIKVSKVTGKAVTVKGRRLMQPCQAKKTNNNCVVSGFEFQQGKQTWLITPNGRFISLKADGKQQSEQGDWVK